VMGKTYEALVRAERALEWASDVSPAREENQRRLSEFGLMAESFREYFACNRIWLTPDVCKRLDEFWDALKAAGYSAADASAPIPSGSILDCRRITREKCGPLKAQIEQDFRHLLGS